MTKFEKQFFLSFKKNLFLQYRGLKHCIVFVFGCVGLLFDSHPLLHVKPYFCSGLEVPTAWRIRPIPKRSSGNGHQRSAISYSNPCWPCTVFNFLSWLSLPQFAFGQGWEFALLLFALSIKIALLKK